MNLHIQTSTRNTSRFTLASRIALIQFIVTLAIAISIGSVSYWLVSNKLEENQHDRLSAQSSALSSIIHGFIDSHIQQLQFLVNDKAIDKYVKSFNELALLRLFVNYDKSFELISFANNQGIEEVKFHRDQKKFEFEDLSATPLFIKATANPDSVQLADSIDGTDTKPAIRIGKFILNYLL